MQVQNYLKNVNFPAKRDKILESARNNDAPKDVIESIQRLPDREYRDANQVNNELSSVQTSGTKTQTGGGGGKTQTGGGGGTKTQTGGGGGQKR